MTDKKMTQSMESPAKKLSELPSLPSAVFSPIRKPLQPTTIAVGQVPKDHLHPYHSEHDLLRKPLNFLDQNVFRRTKSDNVISFSVSKKLNFSDLDDVPEEESEKEKTEQDGKDVSLQKNSTAITTETAINTENSSQPKTDDTGICSKKSESIITADTGFSSTSSRSSTSSGERRLEPIAEEFITDLLCKPLSISPTGPAGGISPTAGGLVTTTNADSPTTSLLTKSVSALTVKTPSVLTTSLGAVAVGSGGTGGRECDKDNQQQTTKGPSPLIDSIKRPADPTWIFESSPTSSRPSKRQKSLSCDTFMAENNTRPFGSSRSLHKSQSDPEAILRAIQQSETDPLLIGDSSKHYALPIMTDGAKHSDLKEITPDTLRAVLNGEYASQLGSYQIIDCRYPYEYDGGHIIGALNLYTQRQVHERFLANLETAGPSTERHILIFHCEFSSQRAPNMCRFVRDFDRTLNKDHYPALHYPELYILHGGYKLFFEEQPQHCTPSSYLPMADDSHAQELSYYKNKTKEELLRGSGLGGVHTAAPYLMSSSMMKHRKTKTFNRLCF